MKNKKFYVRRLFNLSLALEGWQDDMNDIMKKMLVPTFEAHNEFRKNEGSMTEEEKEQKTIELVNEYMKIVNRIGQDRFTTYEDGGIEYNNTLSNK